MIKNQLLSISFILMAVLAGCSAMPDKNASLEEARGSYRDAQSDPQVVNLAALELKEAGDALDKANAAWTRKEDSATVDHLAYVAKRRVVIAQEIAKGKGAEAAVAHSDTESAKIQLAARTEEADKSQRSAEMSKQQAQDAETHAAQLQSQLNDLNARQTDRGVVVTLGDVLFDTNKAQLKSGGVRAVQKLADILKQNPQRKIFVEGFTDSRGSDSYNQDLSERRANAVRDTLLGMGVSGDRIATRGYGKNFPVASNDSDAGQQLNRRVEIVISDESGNIRSR